MIVATGNNFGAGEILINDYQNENLVVLNSKICFNPKNEDFQKASQLEIYVPDLSIPRSGISGCFILVPIEDRFYGTTLKTWVKDRNTVCVEKMDFWSDMSDEFRIYLLSLYVPKGQRQAFQCKSLKNLTVTFLNTDNRFDNTIYYEEDGWCMFAFTFSSYSAPRDGLEEIIQLEGFADDVDIELPFVSSTYNGALDYGNDMQPARLQNSTINAGVIPFGWGGMPADYFFYAVCVRNGHNVSPLNIQEHEVHSINRF